MKAVIQRVSEATLTVAGQVRARVPVGGGLVVLVGVEKDDTELERRYLAEKIARLRIFEDVAGKMNTSLADRALSGGANLMLVPNFTLAADCRKGRRPSFDGAMAPEAARGIVHLLAEDIRAFGVSVEEGVFGAEMLVSLTNDGPVTIVLDTRSLLGDRTESAPHRV